MLLISSLVRILPRGRDLDAIPRDWGKHPGTCRKWRNELEKKSGCLPKEASTPLLNRLQPHLLPLGEAFLSNNDCDDLAGFLSLDAGKLLKGFSSNNYILSCTANCFLQKPCFLWSQKKKVTALVSSDSSCCHVNPTGFLLSQQPSSMVFLLFPSFPHHVAVSVYYKRHL